MKTIPEPPLSARADLLFALVLANRALVQNFEARCAQCAGLEDNVLANIGHELRTPLTIIQGLSEILLDETAAGSLDPAQLQDFLGMIHRASLSLGKLVETSILLTKIQAGGLDLDLQSLNLREAIERVIGQYTEEVAAKNLTIKADLPRNLPPVWADGFGLELVLQALYDNAIKFNHPEGGICWTAWLNEEQVCFSISDSGVGIPPEKLNGLFGLFGQLENGSTRRFGGLGLGLPLVKRLLMSFEGTIQAQSPGPNKGSTFTVTLRQTPC